MMPLSPRDIEGKTIRRVLVSPAHVEPDGYGAVRTVIETADAISFELRSQDTNDRSPLYAFAEDITHWSAATLAPTGETGAGETIRKLVVSDLWPGLGLLLESNRLIYCSNDFHIHLVEPCIATLGDFYTLADLAPFWP